MIETIQWTPGGVVMIDQTRLPREEECVTCKDYREVADAIRTMIIRGAPAIGVAAAMGVAIGVLHANPVDLDRQFDEICRELAGTRPTAVNLFWAIDRMKRVYAEVKERSIEEIRERLIAEAKQVYLEDIAINEAIGKHGAELVPDGKTVLTHCNAGALATAGYGTALGVIRAAVSAGKKVDVFADETRPFLQGARLTVWELMHDGIPATLITDNMAGHFLKSGRIGCVVVGADRIAANGDVANKIGTYSVAVLARENGVPFYVAAPISTLDLTLDSGDKIPIEERAASEVTNVHGVPVAPEGVAVANPAFDVTPAKYVTGIITERGVAWPPYGDSLRRLAENEPRETIQHVSDTALLVAACRAMETELEDGFVRDPFAAQLAGERGHALAHDVDASKWLAFGVGIRSHFVDELLLDVIGRGEIDTVVSLGAGLDTRPWRLDLPASLRWVEVDFPEILAYKEERLGGAMPKCRRETLTADLNEEEQRKRVLESKAGSRALLMTEGLLTYLPGDTVRALAEDAQGFHYWMLDVISHWMMSRLPGRYWSPFDRVRSKSRLTGDEILEAAMKSGWTVAANRRNMVEGVQIGARRMIRMSQEMAARGESRREAPPADDVTGVWLFGR